MPSFVHLHVHTQYSILDGLSDIGKLFERARELGMPALAITDHGNMYGIKEFFKHANDKKNLDENKNFIVKPIVGCEVYVTRHYDHNLKDNDHKKYYHLILLAKNYDGYKNLIKLVSTGHVEGMYYKPRIDHELLEKYHENLICCSACLAGEVPQDIMAGDIEEARKAIEWHRSLFGDDYYLEVMMHRTEVEGLQAESYAKLREVADCQKVVDAKIFELAQEMGVKVVATNDVHFIRKEDGPVHDRLICLTTNANVDDPKRLRYTQQEYLKSREEMESLFPDHPEALDNTLEVASKIEAYQIDRPHVLPKFEIDPSFLEDIDSQLEKYKDVIEVGKYSVKKDGTKEYRGDEFCKSVAFLCHLTYEGARLRYGDTLTDEQSERIDFELKTISRMGFPDYFLIVQDYIRACRSKGSMVGPGRGSAAGSVVAYCLNITNLDPIRYNLLFERFLNPDRISMPDIDVDFEDLQLAHRYVEDKYHPDHVSRVITFGTMAAKSAIKDVARISQVSIDESNRLAKMVPDRLSEKVEKTYPFNPKFDELKPGFKQIEEDGKTFQRGMEEVDVKITLKNCYRLVPEFKDELENGPEINKEVLKYALQLEGSIRQVGQHACATIIGRGNLTDFIPICLSKDKETGLDVWTSQYDGHYIEDVGMLKMDFLGLNTLSIIHTCLDLIKERFGKEIDIEAIPIDDKETYEKIYSQGDTVSVFQFESPGMMKWLQNLHPERFEDLIAMNALYRPGPMDYIPSFVARKLGQEPIEYDLPEMEEYLAETYGVTVYQEQVMLLSRKLASFTKGEADKLRKAMGKKQIAVMQELKEKFMTQGTANGHPEKTLDKIWKDWEKFAQYAFNKSHATCYAWVSYQTGWLKCHYPSEFQAANLSCNLGKSDEIKKIMEDCRRSGIKVLNPDVNESAGYFTVNREGNIRFGLGGMKGFGTNVVDAIVSERREHGLFKDVFDFVERMAETAANSQKAAAVNRKSLETLVYAGAFDSFGVKRSQFFQLGKSGDLFLDELARYSDLYRNDKMDNSVSLFGDVDEFKPTRPEIPEAPAEENALEYLQHEKEIVGMYLSSHPLDAYSPVIGKFVSCELSNLQQTITECENSRKGCKVTIAGIVTAVEGVTTKSGQPGARVMLEDYSGNYEFRLYGKDYESFMAYMQLHAELFIEGEIAERFRLKPEDIKAGKTAPFSFRPKKIALLGNVGEDLVKNLMLTIPSDLLNADFRKRLVKSLKTWKGKIPVSVYLTDRETGYRLEFNCKKYEVNLSPDFISEMERMGVRTTIKAK